MDIDRMHDALAQLGQKFSMGVLTRPQTRAQIEGALERHGRLKQRHSPLRPLLVFWLVLCLPLFRTKSILNVLGLLIGALRGQCPWLSLKPVTDGAIAHARVRLGVAPVREFFEATAEAVQPVPSFHGLRPWAIDGKQCTLPDTPENEARYGRPKASRGRSAWPQLRMVALSDVVSRRVAAAAMAGCRHASERALARPLFARLGAGDLALCDRGFYEALQMYRLRRQGAEFLVRLPATVKPKVVATLGRGDYRVEITGRRPLAAGETYKPPRGRTSKTCPFTLSARMIVYQVEGESEPVRLLTSLLDPHQVSARELAALYHERWEAEISFDELATHLASVKHGTQHTTFRGKNPDLVAQEFWALLAVYNLVRDLIEQAAHCHRLPPREISFVDALHVIELSLPEIQNAPAHRLAYLYRRLLRDLAACRLDRPRRPRVYPRVVKTKMSNFALKRHRHRQQHRNIQKDLSLVEITP